MKTTGASTDNNVRTWKRVLPAGLKDAFHATRAGLRLLLAAHSPMPVLPVLPHARRLSMLSTARLLELYRLAMMMDGEGVAGDFVECGVYRGGSAAVLGCALRQSRLSRRLWLFDSFQGMPAPGERDGGGARHFAGQVLAEPAQAQNLLLRLGVPPSQTRIVPGWFADTFSSAQIERIALLHIDADWYDSVRLCLERFYDVLAAGAVVVLDDYHDWPGCRAALDDFARSRGLHLGLVENGDGAPYFRAPAAGAP